MNSKNIENRKAQRHRQILTTENKKKGGGAHLDVAGHCLREGSGSSTTAWLLEGGALTHGRTRAPAIGTAAALTPFLWPPRADAAPCSPLCEEKDREGKEGLVAAQRKQRKGAKKKEAWGRRP